LTEENTEVTEVEQEVTEVETQAEDTQEEATEETTEETPPEEGEADDSEATAKAQAKEGFWKRQQKLKEDAERLRQENEYLKTMANKPPPQQQAKQEYIPNPNEPILNDYLDNDLTPEQWSRDHRAFLDQEAQAKAQQRTLATTYEQRLKDYAEVNKDIYAYEQDVARNVSPVVASAIMDSENSAQIIEVLALDPTKYQELNNSRDMFQLAKNIIKLEGGTKGTPSFSNAPKPVKKLKGEPAIGSKSDNLSLLSKEEYFAKRRKQNN
jgi:hypothetical protein